MRKKRTSNKKKKVSAPIDLHMYGIYDKKNNTLIKISLDPSEIQMEIALDGGLGKNFSECEFNIRLEI